MSNFNNHFTTAPHLVYFYFCPFSRLVRVVLNKYGIDYELHKENHLTLNYYTDSIPEKVMPILIHEGAVISGLDYILHYIHQHTHDSFLGSFLHPIHNQSLPNDLTYKLNNQLVRLYHVLAREVYFLGVLPIIQHKILLRIYPNNNYKYNNEIVVRALKFLDYYWDLFNKLLSDTDYILGFQETLLDTTLLCLISVLDYINEMDFKNREALKEWYLVMKSKIHHQCLFTELYTDLKPQPNYSLFDF